MAARAERKLWSWFDGLLTILLQLPGYVLACWAVVVFAIGVGNHNISLPVGIVEAAIGLYVCVWVHELGHGAAAVLVKWRVITFAVRPFALQLANREIVRTRRDEDQELGGYVFAVPSGPESVAIWRKAVIVAAGPLAGILFGAMAIGLALRLQGDVRHPAFFAPAAFAVGLESLALAYLSLLPTRSGRHQTDGRTLWWLVRHRTDYDRLMPITWLEALSDHQVRLREQPQWLMDLAERRLAGSEGATRWFDARRIGRMLDSERVDPTDARAAMEAYRAAHGVNEWHSYCDAYLAAVWEGDGEGAAASLWRGEERHDSLAPLRFAAEAAAAARLGHAEAARVALGRMSNALNRKSRFTDLTFRDIRRRIEAIVA